MQYDIIIIGGGMVGASLACALQNTSLRIALIDALPHAAADDPRLIALTHGSCNLLKNLDIWPLLAPFAEPIKQIHVSHLGRFGITRIHAADINLEALGHLIPAKYINSALDEKLKALSNIEIIRPATLKNIVFEENKTATLTIESSSGKKTMQARIVIGADGTHSTVRELLQIQTKTIDYDQRAIVTITQLQRPHQNIAYERFQKNGAIAMLPLSDQCCATIWTETNEKISQLMQLSDTEFLTTLQQSFGYRLGRFKKIHQRHTYPLKLILAEETQKNNVILIGNAAHTLHPIAAQGFNLALHEVAVLAELFTTHPVEPSTAAFANITNNRPGIELSHQLTWIFSSDFFILNLARQLGMVGLDFCLPAKKLFMQKAMGHTGKIPPLLREKDYYEHHQSGY